MHRMPARPLVLASTSPYRRELLGRLRIPFETASPGTDETALPGESPPALAQRLALAKASGIADARPDAIVIGSDQVADLDGEAISKPGDHERATAQLRRMRGRRIVFHTAVAVLCIDDRFRQQVIATATASFRALTDDEIERYLRADQPYDCAGSARSEGLGVSLLDAIDSDDPTTLVGLPLIRVCAMLRAAGLRIPA